LQRNDDTMKSVYVLTFSTVALMCLVFSCDERPPTTDEQQSKEQAQALEQAHAQVGMPAIGDFSEKRLLKDIYEMRDKPMPTHSYIVNEMSGCLIYLGPSIGYGLPYSTQYTAPSHVTYVQPGGVGGTYYVEQVPQAEPNGLFMPGSAEGTWIQLKSPTEDKVQPVYIEPRVIVSPFRMPTVECSQPVPRPTEGSTSKSK
jgi:hypothetical protein